jgi:hypothetical protein
VEVVVAEMMDIEMVKKGKKREREKRREEEGREARVEMRMHWQALMMNSYC